MKKKKSSQNKKRPLLSPSVVIMGYYFLFLLLGMLLVSFSVTVLNDFKVIKIILIAVGCAVSIWCALVIIFRKLGELRYRKMLLNSGIDAADMLTPYEFEQYIAALFKLDNYNVFVTPKSRDFGIDLVVEKDCYITAIQIKKYTNNVGIEAVQQTIAGMNYYNADYGMVITTAPNFTTAAKNLASTAPNVFLVERSGLIKMLTEIKRKYNR